MLQGPLENIGDDMKPEEMSKSITDCKAEINKLNKKINDIQAECNHTDYEVKAVGTAPIKIKRICRVCDMDLGYPTDDEIKKAGY